MRDINSANRHRRDGAIHICGEPNERPVVLRIVHEMIHDDGIPVRNNHSIEQVPKSLQRTPVSIAFSLADCKRHRYAERRLDHDIVGIHRVHVGENVAPIDEEPG